MKTELSIIVVAYNSEEEIGRLLTSIKKSPDKLTKEIIVIDNASQDHSVDVVKNHPLQVNLIKSPVNIGFSKAVNLGIKQSVGDYVLLLNPDTRLIGSCLQNLVSFASSHIPLGAVAPRLVHPNGRVQASIFHFPTIAGAIRFYFLDQPEYFGKYTPAHSPVQVDAAVMAAFLIPHSVVDRIGLLSEKFFMYYEDIEFCRRLKKAKLPVYYYAKAKVEHVHGASGKFTSHLNSPLARSSRIYHGALYSNVLNFILWIGQKWQKVTHPK